MAQTSTKFRNFAFTDYILDVVFWEDICKSQKVKYLLLGDEVCPSTGKRHFQGFIIFEHPRTLNNVIKLFAPRHTESCYAAAIFNNRYCSKSGNLALEYGEKPVGKGKRTDIDAVKTMVKDGAGLKDIWNVTTSYQSLRFAQIGFQLYAKKRDWKTYVIWCWGPTGSGKSKWAFETYPNSWCGGNIVNGFVFDGYNGEDTAILDDFRSCHMKFHEILRLFDRYQYRVRTIGGSTEFLARTLVVTTCYRPEEFYKEEREDIGQLIRRIDEVKYFGPPKLEQEQAQRSGSNTKFPTSLEFE